MESNTENKPWTNVCTYKTGAKNGAKRIKAVSFAIAVFIAKK